MWSARGTLTGYLIGVVIVFAIINGLVWHAQSPKQHDLAVFSTGFVLGALGMYIRRGSTGIGACSDAQVLRPDEPVPAQPVL